MPIIHNQTDEAVYVTNELNYLLYLKHGGQIIHYICSYPDVEVCLHNYALQP